jgi:phospholipase/lecithinase/hemolysin
VGARNFLFLNVPPVDKSPLTASQGAAAQAGEAEDIAAFNSALSNLVSNLIKSNPDTTTFLFDAHALFTAILQNPRQFPPTRNLKNLTNYCGAYAE